MSIIEEHTALLPYIPGAMHEVGLPEIGEAMAQITTLLSPVLDDADIKHGCMSSEVSNFIRNVPEGKWFKITKDVLKRYSKEEREKLADAYLKQIEKLDNLVADRWNYGCPDNEGWGVVSRYLQRFK